MGIIKNFGIIRDVIIRIMIKFSRTFAPSPVIKYLVGKVNLSALTTSGPGENSGLCVEVVTVLALALKLIVLGQINCPKTTWDTRKWSL